MPWAEASALDGSAKDGTKVAAKTLRRAQTTQGAILPDVEVFGRGNECILVRLPAAHESGNLRSGAASLPRQVPINRPRATPLRIKDDSSLTRLRRSVAIFDLGGVLIEWNPRHLYRKLFNGDEAAMEHFLANVCTTEWNQRQDAGRTFAEGTRELMPLHA